MPLRRMRARRGLAILTQDIRDGVLDRAACGLASPPKLPPPRRQQHILGDARLRVAPEHVAAKVRDELSHPCLGGVRQPHRVPEGGGGVALEARLADLHDEKRPRDPALERQPGAPDVVGDEQRDRTVAYAPKSGCRPQRMRVVRPRGPSTDRRAQTAREAVGASAGGRRRRAGQLAARRSPAASDPADGARGGGGGSPARANVERHAEVAVASSTRRRGGRRRRRAPAPAWCWRAKGAVGPLSRSPSPAHFGRANAAAAARRRRRGARCFINVGRNVLLFFRAGPMRVLVRPAFENAHSLRGM